MSVHPAFFAICFEYLKYLAMWYLGNCWRNRNFWKTNLFTKKWQKPKRWFSGD